MKLTIGQFNESFPPIVDGVANVVKNYAYWINEKYGDCIVVTPKHPDAEDHYPFKVKRYSSMKVPTRNEYRFGWPHMDTVFWKKLKEVPFDIVHAHCPFSSGWAARSIAKKRDIPFVATFHSKFRDDFKASLKSDVIVDGVLASIASFFESADEVWVVSEACKETLREYGYKGDSIVMTNGCDIVPEKPSPQSCECVDRTYGLLPDDVVFVFVGQHIWQKNVELTIGALKVVADRGYDFKMLFVGDGANRPDMEKMVEQFGLEGRVIFAGRVHDRQMIKNIYHRSRAMLFPSYYDTSGIVIKEAAACYCPSVVAKDSCVSCGITADNGYITDNDPQSMADTIIGIIDDGNKCACVGENAFTTLYSDWEQCVDLAVDRYRYLINKRRGHTNITAI
jgi:glycosyltransferase involved in cell wall biosynthesis